MLASLYTLYSWRFVYFRAKFGHFRAKFMYFHFLCDESLQNNSGKNSKSGTFLLYKTKSKMGAGNHLGKIG